jgi:hypothetical protein
MAFFMPPEEQIELFLSSKSVYAQTDFTPFKPATIFRSVIGPD